MAFCWPKLFLLLSLLAPAMAEANIKNQLDFLDYLNQTEFKAILLYNSSNTVNSMNFMVDLSEKMKTWEIVIENSVEIAVIDVSKIEKLKKQFDLPEKHALWFFFRNDKFDFSEFNRKYRLLMTKEISFFQMKESIEDFLRKSLGFYATPLNTLEEARLAVAKNPTIAVYVGKNNFDFEIFLRFAYSLPDLAFFYIFDKPFGIQFLKEYSNEDDFNTSHLLLLRNQSNMDEHETNGSGIFKGTRNYAVLKRFIQWERFAKLRKDDDFPDQIFDFFANKDRMLLYVNTGDLRNSQNFKEFKNAIKLLPKSMMYCYSHPRTDSFPYLMHLFDLAGKTISVETIYFLRIDDADDVEIITMKKDITKEKIIEFVIEIFKKHQGEIREVPFLNLDNVRRNAPGSVDDLAHSK